jgi:uncharacterized protein (DUF58 family)
MQTLKPPTTPKLLLLGPVLWLLGWLRRLTGPLLLLLAALAYGSVRVGAWPWLLSLGLGWLLLQWGYRRAPHMKVERQLSALQSFTGSPVTVTTTVTIIAKWPTLLTWLEPVPKTLITAKPASISGLFWGQSVHVCRYQVNPNSRGRFDWPASEVNWSDPLGFSLFDCRIVGEGPSLLVYPGIHPLLLADLARPLLNDGPPARQRALEDPASPLGAREYLAGDPLNRIHWKQTARHGLVDGRFRRLVVREIEQVAATGLLVYLDTSPSGRAGEVFLESAVRLAASLLTEAVENGLSVGFNGELARGFDALAAALAALAELKLTSNTLPTMPTPPPGSNMVMITMNAPLELLEMAMQARARAARVWMLVLPEGFYLEPGESPRPLFVSPPDQVKNLEARAGLLRESGIYVTILRGDESVLRIVDG